MVRTCSGLILSPSSICSARTSTTPSEKFLGAYFFTGMPYNAYFCSKGTVFFNISLTIIYLGTQHTQQATDQNIRNDHSGILRYIPRCDPLTPWAQFGLPSKVVLRWSSIRVDTNNLGPKISVSCNDQANDLGHMDAAIHRPALEF